ncbi:hypothetical protein HY3_14905 [Hyphomonas pacifica]|uniref:Uncharacterized protein n=2 Tax=Hyphomonas pacifica TaxID=1280941 RepID=A0A062U2G5_9PROT|nr:hypothetical protein HY2_14425 [Hyphomonas pacifica]RAN32613.1 hypothetical protein HY3_14905 [Hyphomonas pacifica]
MDAAGLFMSLRPLSGDELEDALPALARLRIQVFEAFPYLYAGTIDYEQDYLRKFSTARDAFIVTAETEAGEIVGCATGSAITDHHSEFAEPLVQAGIDLPSTFYFGESVLLPEWRGHGLGHKFFDAREQHARKRGYARSCFCAVMRPADHPKRPADYSPLDTFWNKRGYTKRPDISANFEWPEQHGDPSLPHTMHYWFHDL